MIYAKLNGLTVENIIVSEDSVIAYQNGYHVKITEITGPAIIGGHYDQVNNKFIDPKPFESWILNDNFKWESPIGENPDRLNKFWDEETQAWVDRV
jgi:hypothetical protein